MSNVFDDIVPDKCFPNNPEPEENVGSHGCTILEDIIPGPRAVPLESIAQKLNATLAERGSRYGDFANNARVTQQIREIVRACESWSKMTPVEREAIDAIILKISRIVTGDPHYPDNWHDIQGFAKLAEDRLPATP